MRNLSIAALVLLTAAACSQSPAESASAEAATAPTAPEAASPPAAAQPASPAPRANSAAPDAVFERTSPARASMDLTRAGENWRVAFRAGGVPNGAATAADCEIQAIGPQDNDDVIAARVVPFEGELNTVTAADIGAKPPIIQVRVGPEGVIVTDAGAAAHLCGLGSDIDGFYRRTGDAY
ncbi:hypothetical protein [Brevundimonas sp.]|uniref:hypothetical protein n=1 Tax=Brevundimonas sp. TaxID=1871086 RepID=UPI0025BBC1C5|nr:hypothetical protein [Brevundimonas sp.]